MKYRLICILAIIVILFACSNDENATSTTEVNLEIIDYNPKQTFTAEEVLIETTRIDSTASIEVFFSGVKASFIEINEAAIKVRVPTGAQSGDITIKYLNQEINLGAIEIVQEMDILYGEVKNNGASNSLHHLDLNDGSKGELVYTAAGYDQVGGITFSKESNTFLNLYSVLCGQTGGCSFTAVLKNRDNKLSSGVSICTDLDCNENFIIKSFSNGRFIFEFFRDDFYSKQVTHVLISIDLYTMQSSTLRDYTIQGESNIERGFYIEDSNEIIGFSSSENFVRFNLNDFSRTEYSFPGTSLSTFIRSESGRIFAVKNTTEVVEINPVNGEIVETIFSGDENIYHVSYSESTGRFFWLSAPNGSSELHIYNPFNLLKTTIQTDESYLKIFTDN